MRRLLGFVITLLLATVGTVWAQAGERVPTLTADDYMQIQQLYSKYYQTYDAGDADGWASVFTADGTFNNTKGKDALKRQIENSTAKGTPLRHWQSNLLLTPVPGGVQGKVYVIQFDIRAKPITPASFSRYDDLLVKTSDGWRFKEKMRSSDTTLGRGGNAGSGNGGAPRQQP
jgi:hypothetical protein